MKNLYLLLFILFTSIYTQAQNQPFITTWEVDANDLSIVIPTDSGLIYNYTVDFGDGTVLTNQTGDAWHPYTMPGIYTVTISGVFPRIYFESFTQQIDLQDIRTVEQWGDNQWQNMEGAFFGCSDISINANDTPNLSLVTSLKNMFSNINNLDVNSSIGNWDISTITDLSYLFYQSHINNLPINNLDVSSVTNMSYMFAETNFNQPINNWDVSNVENMSYMFANSLFNSPIYNWNTSYVENMSYMFNQADYFNQPIGNWNVSNVTDMEGMFFSSNNFNQPLDSWDVSNVTNMSKMLSRLRTFNQPLNNWDVSSVTDMSYLFRDSDVFNQALDNWNVSNVTNMSEIFAGATAFDQPINTWNVSNVLNMSGMFTYHSYKYVASIF